MKVIVDISFEELLKVVKSLPDEQLAQVKKVLDEMIDEQNKTDTENI
jgi:argonaute-like protein implicated in RNA metabolism and viral defense